MHSKEQSTEQQPVQSSAQQPVQHSVQSSVQQSVQSIVWSNDTYVYRVGILAALAIGVCVFFG